MKIIVRIFNVIFLLDEKDSVVIVGNPKIDSLINVIV